jgi:DNA-directed RNA polymerase beta' subunit
MKKVDELLT